MFIEKIHILQAGSFFWQNNILRRKAQLSLKYFLTKTQASEQSGTVNHSVEVNNLKNYIEIQNFISEPEKEAEELFNHCNML